jgi:hypothetical protein
VKKSFLVLLLCSVVVISFGQDSGKTTRQQKKQQRKERINQLMKEEEEGALIYNKQGAFGIKLNTDGYGIFYEHGRYKTINLTNLWWVELGERKNSKEERISGSLASNGAGNYIIGNSYIFGKRNNFYYLKLGLGQQRLIGGKGNKNGVAVSAIYGGGFSAGLLKPYYLKVITNQTQQDIKYNNNDSVFLDPSAILGSASFTKGFGEIKFVPGAHARAALRFDYGRYNELLSAIEVGINAEFYTQKMPIMVNAPAKQFFFNGYVALVFGKRK